MELKAALSKRGICRLAGLADSRQSKRNAKSKVMAALVQAKREGSTYEETKENGVTRIRLVAKKRDLMKILELVCDSDGDGEGDGYGYVDRVVSPDRSVPYLAENRLDKLQKNRNGKKARRVCWTPVLQTISEEF